MLVHPAIWKKKYIIACNYSKVIWYSLMNRARFGQFAYNIMTCITEKKVEPKRLYPGAVLENGATWEGGAVFSLIITSRKKQLHLWRWRQNSARAGAELRTMKRLQGWSCLGSTFFFSVMGKKSSGHELDYPYCHFGPSSPGPRHLLVTIHLDLSDWIAHKDT